MKIVKSARCCRCKGEIEENRTSRFAYCRKCQTEMSGLTRKSYGQLTPEQKQKANARAYAKEYLKRGKLTKQPCIVCGCDESEMHHPDYSKPLFVIWLCRPCHLELHLLLIEEMNLLFTKQLKEISERPDPTLHNENIPLK